ncbi:uncharacterized protein ACBR49_004806 [Aulostomus maculatus]
MKKTTTWKYRKGLSCLVTFAIVSLHMEFADAHLVADQNYTCYACMEENHCPKLNTIFASDVLVYKRQDPDKTFPNCSGITAPSHPMTCDVCKSESTLIVICSQDVTSVDVETKHEEIQKKTKVSCPIMINKTEDVAQVVTQNAHHGLTASAIVVAAVVVTVVLRLLLRRPRDQEQR